MNKAPRDEKRFMPNLKRKRSDRRSGFSMMQREIDHLYAEQTHRPVAAVSDASWAPTDASPN